MHIILNGMTCRFFGCLEQRAYVDVKTDVGKCRSNNFCSSVVTILAQFYYQHAWAATLFFGKSFDVILDIHVVLISLIGGAINAGDRLNDRSVPFVNGFESI